MKNKPLLTLFPLLTIIGCLGPNPDYKPPCGKTYAVDAAGAVASLENDAQTQVICDVDDCSDIRAEICVSEADAEDLEQNPDGLLAESLKLSALSACKERAAEMGPLCQQG